MPHRVANFIKSSTNSFESQVLGLKKNFAPDAPRRKTSPRRSARASRSSERVVSYASTTTEDEVEESPTPPPVLSMRRMVEASTRHSSSTSSSPSRSPVRDPHQVNHHRKLSFPSLHLPGRSSRDGHSNSHAALDWKLESPPVVFFDAPEDSSGAIVSGQFFLKVTRDEGLEFESLNASLSIHTTHKRPFASHCHDCSTQVTEVRKWTFLDRPLFLAKGQHAFPFSVLLEGQLPISLDSPTVSVSYNIKAEAVSKLHGSQLPTIKLEKVLDVKRSVPVPELPHHSVRVFPPTNVKASVHYPAVIHPIGENTLSLRLDGIAKHNEKTDMIEYWKLKKLTWRLDETIKSFAPACAKHAPKDSTNAGDPPPKPGSQRLDTRTIGEKTLFSGWKSHYTSPADSVVEMELDYQLAKNARFSCNAKTPEGLDVSHQFMIEMVVSQELAPASKPSQSTPTGVGRILRMHFATVLTERGGIGISWDNEAPPIYQDVPPSPPAYPGSDVANPMDAHAWDHAMESLDGIAASASPSNRCSVDMAASREANEGGR